MTSSDVKEYKIPLRKTEHILYLCITVKLIARLFFPAAAILLVFSSCSTGQNTAMTRFYHSFTARYNTYFNGHEAYREGVAAQTDGNRDNYTDMLPFFAVSNKETAAIGKGNFTTAIEKCEKAIKNHSIKRKPKFDRSRRKSAKRKKELAKKEYNPFLKNAWMLMGLAQFHQGNFIEAASTFSYICRLYSTESDVLQEARAWLAACYSELGWYYDAEDLFRNKIGRDSVPRSARAALVAAYADYYTRQKRYTEALPYIRQSVKQTRGAIPRARLYYLLAQIYERQNDRKNAYRYLSKVIRRSPPYEVQLNARIMQAEMVSERKSKSMISRLRSMARKDKNKNYFDQIYHAIGNIQLSSGDTAEAVKSYETGVGKSTRSGVEKGALLLKLGSIYLAREDFASAKRCLSPAVGMISKERPDYDSITRLSKVIDELEPNTTIVFTQDSMQALAKMPKDKQNEVFDKAIELAKKKIREDRRKSAASEARKGGSRAASSRNTKDSNTASQTTATGYNSGKWYFYNPEAVENGKEAFTRNWGDRPNEDNWRRSNKELSHAVSVDEESEEGTPKDSTAAKKNEGETAGSSTKATATNDTASARRAKEKGSAEKQDERLTREYYLKQLPLTEEQLKESDSKIAGALHKAGVTEKDKLEDLPLARRSLTRIVTEYPDYKGMDDVLYELFLLESQTGNKAEAQHYKDLLATKFPEAKLTRLITDPNFEYDARYGRETEDSLYRATYNAWKSGRTDIIKQNAAVSASRFPEGDNRAKFMFLDAMAQLHDGDRATFLSELDSLLKAFPKDDITPIAKSIYDGVKAGRAIGSSGYDLTSLWDRRIGGANATLDSIETSRQLSKEKNTPFTVIIAYPADSVDQNVLLYNIARYNFTNFEVRNFEIGQTVQEGLGEIIIKGFNNFDEAHSYVQMLYSDAAMQRSLRGTRIIVISNDNMQKLGTDYSISDYQKFYDRNFAPIKLKPGLMLDRQTDIYQSEDTLPESNEEQKGNDKKLDENDTGNDENDNNDNDDGWYDLN